MKKNNTFTKFTTCLILILGLFLTSNGNAQACVGNQVTLTIDNVTATENTIEYDIFIKNTGVNTLDLSGYYGSVLYSDNLLPLGATGTFEVVDQPSVIEFPGIPGNSIVGVQYYPLRRELRFTFVGYFWRTVAPLISFNVNYKFARYRFTSSIPWDVDTIASLSFADGTFGGVAQSVVTVYCNDNFGSTSLISGAENLIVNVGGTSGNVGATINFRLLSTDTIIGNSPMIAFPNPFGEGFTLKSDTTSADLVTIKVYDMLGKVIEQRQVIASELSKQELGTSYQAGLYNVMVAQGNQQQTIRVIKK